MVFSIIIPCYNSSNYIENAINSVLNQTYDSFELIAIDDGSTDGTLKILEEYRKKDKRVKVIHKKNGGYSTAINYGLDNIVGEYFLMMGSDDSLLPNLLEKAYEYIKGNNPDMLAYRVIKHWNNDNKKESVDFSTVFDKYISFNGTYRDFYKEYEYEARFFSLRDTGKIYKRLLLNDLRYFGSYGFDADGFFSLLFAHRSHVFAVTPIDGYVWNIRGESLSNRQLSIEVYIDRLKNSINLIKSLKKISDQDFMDIDFEYVIFGDKIVTYLRQGKCINYLKNYIIINNYYHNLRKVLFKNRCLKRFGFKFLLKSYFPFSCFCCSKFIKVFKNEKR